MAAPSKKSMPYVRLGNSGLKVSRLILGTMQYGSSEWQSWVVGEEEAFQHIKFAYNAGIQTFDTADMYSNGLSEVILGKAIKKLKLPRDEIVVMTKVYNAISPDHSFNFMKTKANPEHMGLVNQHGLSRKHIFGSIKRSLERLQLEYVDVLQCHRFDYNTPIEETMKALHDVVKAGYARYIGMSSCWAYQFQAMQNYAINSNLTPFISMQNQHSLIYREEEREMFPTLKMFHVGAIPYSTLGRGLLSRPSSQKTTRGATDISIGRYKGAGTQEIIARVEEIARKRSISMAQVATAWSLSKEGVIAPIVGTTSLEKLQDIIGSVDVKLTNEEIAYLEEPYRSQNIIAHV